MWANRFADHERRQQNVHNSGASCPAWSFPPISILTSSPAAPCCSWEKHKQTFIISHSWTFFTSLRGDFSSCSQWNLQGTSPPGSPALSQPGQRRASWTVFLEFSGSFIINNNILVFFKDTVHILLMESKGSGVEQAQTHFLAVLWINA